MRLTDQQVQAIRQVARELAGPQARVRLFGSRLDDAARGGDVDLLLELPCAVDQPALLAARVSARISRLMHGRRVDVVVSAPTSSIFPFTRWHSQRGGCYDPGRFTGGTLVRPGARRRGRQFPLRAWTQGVGVIEREISVRVYAPEDFRSRRTQGDSFLNGVLNGPLTPLLGSPDDA